MKKQISAKYNASSQRGVALLFALGILSVLMVLGLAFVSNALIAQKISVNNANRSQADVMAQSAINRVLTSVKLYSEDVLFNSFSGNLVGEYLVSKAADVNDFNPSTNAGDGLSTWGGLADVNSIMGSLSGADNSTAFPADGMPEWHLVFDSTDSSTRRVIGRYAYAVLPFNSFPQLDFTTVHADIVGPPVIDANGVTPKQMGCNVVVDGNDWYSQFGFTPVVPLGEIWRSYSQIFTRQNVTVPKQKLIRRFFEVNYPPMIEAYKAIDGLYYHRFNLIRTDWKTLKVSDLLSDGAVAYWNTGTPRSINTTTETTALPFLSRIGSDGATFPDLATRRKQIAANLIDYCINDTITPPTSSLTQDASTKWDLTTNIPEYTGNKQSDYIYEIGFEFNLLKTDTSNYDDNGFTISPSNAAATHKIQYALGVLPIVKLVQMYADTPSAYKFANSLTEIKLQGKVSKCSIEVVYMDNTLPIPVQQTATLQFDVSAPDDTAIGVTWTDVQPSGEVDIGGAADLNGFKVQVPLQNFAKGGLRTGLSPQFTINTSNIASLSKVQAQRSDATSIVSVKLVSVDEVKISSLSATIGNMVLYNSGGSFTFGYDYVKGPLSPLVYSGTVTLAKDTDPAKNFKFAMGSAKGIDPRQNLNSGDWDCSTAIKVTQNLDSSNRFLLSDIMDVTSTGGGDYKGDCNTNSGANPYNPATAADFTKDRETVSSPGYTSGSMISTAKFPASGKSMQTPAELGYIHRGAKWETLNLANADGMANDTTSIDVKHVTDLTKLNATGTSYENGDGGIFDMVKFIDYSSFSSSSSMEKYYTYGKIDLNSVDGSGLSPSGSLPGDYMYANWLYRVVDTNDISKMIKMRNDATKQRLKTRAKVLVQSGNHGLYDAWSTVSPSVLTNKEQMDEYPGNLINLTEACSIPMVFRAIIKAQSIKDLGPKSGSATITKMINGTMKSNISISRGIYDVEGDDVTGEVSYLVTIVRHPETNQFFVVDKVQITE